MGRIKHVRFPQYIIYIERIITVIQPGPKVTIDRFGQFLETDFRIVGLFRDRVPRVEECAGGIVVLGGTMNAVEGSEWLLGLRQLLVDAVAKEISVLGICLGHQVLATAFGGEVAVGTADAKEDGPYESRVNDAGQADPVLRVLGESAIMPESHNDAVTVLPPNAQLLASSSPCEVQAMRIGSAVSVQFHPEASPATMARWAEMSGLDGAEMQARMELADAPIRAAGQAIAAAFSAECGA